MSELTDCSGAHVTVVIAAFNAASTLDQALASVAGQSVQPSAVIVADDCSTDDTGSVAERWHGRLPLEVIRLERNGGPAVARSRGIESARSPLVALLDADDVWLPDHLETMLAAYRRQPGVVTADALPWIAGSVLATRSFGADRAIPPPGRQLLELVRRNYVFMGTLFSRARYLELGGFRSQFRGTEDWDLWIRMARSGVPFSRPEHPTVLYRMAPSSLSARDGQLDADVAVIEAGLVEAVSDDERRAMRAKARSLDAQRWLFVAYDRADAGRRLGARAAALRALRGQRRVVARGAVMLVAPRWGARQREARRFQPRWWFKRV